MKHVLLWFIDGLGLGEADTESNPLTTAPMPVLRSLLGGRSLTRELGRLSTPALELIPTDPLLDIPGLPQSATGQTALFTGINAAQAIGRHLTAFPSPALRDILAQHSLLKDLAEAGLSVTSANAYNPNYFELVAARKRRHSASTLSILAAGLALRQDIHQLINGQAVYQDLTNEMLRQQGFDVPIIPPSQAGANLADITVQHDFTLFEYFQTDLAGHSRDRSRCEIVLAAVDQALGGLINTLDLTDTLVILTSDHGNIENIGGKPHTMNPVPTLAIGADREDFAAEVHSLTDIARAIKKLWNLA